MFLSNSLNIQYNVEYILTKMYIHDSNSLEKLIHFNFLALPVKSRFLSRGGILHLVHVFPFHLKSFFFHRFQVVLC